MQQVVINKILLQSEQNKIIDFALKHPTFFCELISYCYPLPATIIEKHEDKWDFDKLSCNISLPWSIELIEKFVNKWWWIYDTVYSTVFKTLLTDNLIDEIMRKMTAKEQQV